MTIQSAFSRALWVPQALQPPPPVANKNWSPGDWISSGTDGLGQDAVWDNPGTAGKVLGTRGILQRLTAVPQYRGALLRYSWDQLERDEGEYDWTETIGGVTYQRGMGQVAERLAQISSLSGRRLIIFIQMKTFGTGNHAAPLYMRNDVTGVYEDGEDYYMTTDESGSVVRVQGSLSGEYAYISAKVPPGPGGYVPNIHVTAVKNRFIALMAEFATRFNDNPYLEAVAFTEASINSPVGSEGALTQTYAGTTAHPAATHVTRPNSNTPATWPGAATWFTNMVDVFTAMRASLTNVQICQWINSDRNDMEDWVPLIYAAGIGGGMPDFCKDEKGFNFTRSSSPAGAPGNIYWMNQNPTDHIRMIHFSKPAMEGSVLTPGQTVGNAAPGQFAFPGLAWTRTEAAGFATTVVPGTHRLWRHMENTKHVDNLTYVGQYFNEVTDNEIAAVIAAHPLEDTPRPTGWT